MLTPLHFWLVFFGTGLLFVFLAYWGGRWRRLNPKEVAQGDGPAGCAHCGYDVRGLPSDVCPECGSNLNEVGRLAPRYRKWQKVPPVLRAVLFTGAVGISAALLILLAVAGALTSGPFDSLWQTYVPSTQVRQQRYMPLHPTLVDAAGTPLRAAAIRTQITRRHPGLEGLVTEAREHKTIVDLYFGNSMRQLPAERLRFETDHLAGRWRAVQLPGGDELEAGKGSPNVETVHRLSNDFAQARAANFGVRQQVAMGSQGLVVPVDQLPPQELGLTQWEDDGTVSLGQAAFLAGYLHRPGEPRADVVAVLSRQDASAGSGWSMATTSEGNQRHVDWYSWLWLIGFWLLVLLIGLWFVTRRREIRPKGDAAFEPATIRPDAGET